MTRSTRSTNTPGPTTTAPTPTSPATYDAVVIGGGAAGLSAALTLGRALRNVLVIDSGHPRNEPAAGAHNLLGNEGINPLDLVAHGQDEARSYGARIVTGTVSHVTGSATDGFNLTTATTAAEVPSTVRARRLVLASGAVDTLPQIPGLVARWGRDVIHCPYCHGYEVRGGRIGVLATGPMWLHQAKLIRQWSDDVTVLLDSQPAPGAEDRAALESRGIRIVEGSVTEIHSAHDQLTGAQVAGHGDPLPLDAILVGTQLRIDSALVSSLGLHTEENPMGEFVPVDMRKATNVPGVFAAGNVTSVGAMVAASMADGVMAGAALNMDLVEEEFAEALALAG